MWSQCATRAVSDIRDLTKTYPRSNTHPRGKRDFRMDTQSTGKRQGFTVLSRSLLGSGDLCCRYDSWDQHINTMHLNHRCHVTVKRFVVASSGSGQSLRNLGGNYHVGGCASLKRCHRFARTELHPASTSHDAEL